MRRTRLWAQLLGVRGVIVGGIEVEEDDDGEIAGLIVSARLRKGGGRPMWRLPPTERRCKTAPTSTFRARRAGRSSLRATSSPDHGPNQVVSASRNPASVPSPTQATCPSGLTSTADGAVTSPTTGSSQMPA